MWPVPCVCLLNAITNYSLRLNEILTTDLYDKFFLGCVCFKYCDAKVNWIFESFSWWWLIPYTKRATKKSGKLWNCVLSVCTFSCVLWYLLAWSATSVMIIARMIRTAGVMAAAPYCNKGPKVKSRQCQPVRCNHSFLITLAFHMLGVSVLPDYFEINWGPCQGLCGTVHLDDFLKWSVYACWCRRGRRWPQAQVRVNGLVALPAAAWGNIWPLAGNKWLHYSWDNPPLRTLEQPATVVHCFYWHHSCLWWLIVILLLFNVPLSPHDCHCHASFFWGGSVFWLSSPGFCWLFPVSFFLT